MTYPRFNDALPLALDASVLQSIDYVLIGIGSLILLMTLGRWAVRGVPDPLRTAPRRLNTLTPELAILPFLVWMVGSYLSDGLIAVINHRAAAPLVPEDLRKLLMATGGQITGSIACLWVGGVYFREGFVGFGFRRKGFWGDLVFAVLAIVAVIPMLFLLNEITAAVISLFQTDFQPPPHKLLQTLETPEQPAWATPVLWASAVLIAPVAEELFFRGIIQTGLRHVFTEGDLGRPEEPRAFPVVALDPAGASAEPTDLAGEPTEASPGAPGMRVPRGRGKWPAILITGALFGMVHYPQPHAVPALILFGIALGYAYEKRGSLVPCIAMHVLFNLKTMLWFTARGLQ